MVLGWGKGDELLNKVVIFVFFARSKSSRSFIKLGWTPDVTWIILTMSLLRFWTLIVVITLLSMEDQKALGFHQKHLIMFRRWTKVLRVWNE